MKRLMLSLGFVQGKSLEEARKKGKILNSHGEAKAGAAQQCHNFCGWLPNAVPLLRQIALLNYVLQNILCKRPLLWGIDIKLQLLQRAGERSIRYYSQFLKYGVDLTQKLQIIGAAIKAVRRRPSLSSGTISFAQYSGINLAAQRCVMDQLFPLKSIDWILKRYLLLGNTISVYASFDCFVYISKHHLDTYIRGRGGAQLRSTVHSGRFLKFSGLILKTKDQGDSNFPNLSITLSIILVWI